MFRLGVFSKGKGLHQIQLTPSPNPPPSLLHHCGQSTVSQASVMMCGFTTDPKRLGEVINRSLQHYDPKSGFSLR